MPKVENINQAEGGDINPNSRVGGMSAEDRQKLVDVFAWLIQEDKKQNPQLYKIKKTKQYDRHSMPLNTQRPDVVSERRG